MAARCRVVVVWPWWRRALPDGSIINLQLIHGANLTFTAAASEPGGREMKPWEKNQRKGHGNDRKERERAEGLKRSGGKGRGRAQRQTGKVPTMEEKKRKVGRNGRMKEGWIDGAARHRGYYGINERGVCACACVCVSITPTSTTCRVSNKE